MPRRTQRRNHNRRKSRRGGILGLSWLKTRSDNKRNCQTQWNPGRIGRCTNVGESSNIERIDMYDYPGKSNKEKGKKVTAKINTRKYHMGDIIDVSDY